MAVYFALRTVAQWRIVLARLLR